MRRTTREENIVCRRSKRGVWPISGWVFLLVQVILVSGGSTYLMSQIKMERALDEVSSSLGCRVSLHLQVINIVGPRSTRGRGRVAGFSP